MSDWRDLAACLDAVDADFFPVTQAGVAYKAAREVCAGCPVIAACLDHAMAFEGARSGAARFGMRGGLTPAERAHAYRATTRAEAAVTKAESVIAVEEHCADQLDTVANLTARGHSAPEISRRLGISARTVVRMRARVRAGVA